MSPTEPRPADEIRSDLATVSPAEWSPACDRLVDDVEPLLDALSSALAAKEAAEAQVRAVEAQVNELERYAKDGVLAYGIAAGWREGVKIATHNLRAALAAVTPPEPTHAAGVGSSQDRTDCDSMIHNTQEGEGQHA